MEFLLTPLREGRLYLPFPCRRCFAAFLLTPLREGRQIIRKYFGLPEQFLLTPLREGRQARQAGALCGADFYSRPCGRGDKHIRLIRPHPVISTHAPAGGATGSRARHSGVLHDFYSRPCGRGDIALVNDIPRSLVFLLTPLREGRRTGRSPGCRKESISTHAPAGGATAIFHKSVMRFCGKLPKDDTVLCLASFGFPRRDPKAVYLAWISCANLPQKCVRQGLALKDQGTSCFHEGLASHAFDPVLV